jgi:hypothetical protein
VIEVMKSNYGPVGEIIHVQWQNGLFVCVPQLTAGSFEKIAVDRNAEELFLRLLSRFEEQGRNVSHAKTSNNYAPTAFTADPDGKGKRKELADAMDRLFAAGKIKVETYGKSSNQHHKLVRCDRQ